ncbi:MAG: diguanylate cyclase [Frankiaceae bacterium]|jgi:diguanylate cyclase (GGDEF)-like protein|nr:diguanylate cyclase [Frankiaceae bacterium]
MTDEEPGQVSWTPRAETLSAEPAFATASARALRLLHEQLGYDAWLVTRIVGEDLVVLDCLDFAYKLRPGSVLPWSATIDWRMVNGQGPRVAPRVADVAAYATAGITQVLAVGSYLGVPLVVDGAVFGTLSAMDRSPAPPAAVDGLPTAEAVGALLAAVIQLELRVSAVARRAERAEVEAHVDPLTQVGNRLAWSKVLVEEEARCRRYGRPACVFSVDLDGLKRVNDAYGHDAGDTLLRNAALALRRVSRMCDQVSRVGGDEFAVLAVESSEIQGRVLLDRIAAAFADVGVEASVGMAVRDETGSLEETWKAADAAMYRNKRSRLQERVSVALAAPAPPLVLQEPSAAVGSGT